jgi:hypothetical protein
LIKPGFIYLSIKLENMTLAQVLAQDLFDKAVEPIMDLPLTDDVIKAKGLEIALIILNNIFDRNTDQSKHDLYCNTHGVLMAGEVEY